MGFEIVEENGALGIVPGKLFRRHGQWVADEESISGNSVSFPMDQPACDQCFARFKLALSEDGNTLSGTTWIRSRGTTEPAAAYKRVP